MPAGASRPSRKSYAGSDMPSDKPAKVLSKMSPEV
jgi:hypothetical protein